MDDATLRHILNILRQGTITWEGRRECLRRARKKVFVRKALNGKEIFKYWYQCAVCKEWFRDEKELEVDHVVEVGPYAGDLHKYAYRMYCDQSNLQAVCLVCHSKKTSGYNSRLNYQRKKKEPSEG